jgi:hypothetical protein
MNITPNPPKTAEQMKFESQWASGMATLEPSQNKKAVEPTIFDPIASSSTQLQSSSFGQSETAAAAPILFGSAANKFSSKHQDFINDEFDDELESFDDSQKVSQLRSKIFDSNSQAIPGLDAPVEQKESEAQDPDIIDLDNDEAVSSSSKTDESCIPFFKSLKNQRVVKIANLLDEPNRHTRPEK